MVLVAEGTALVNRLYLYGTTDPTGPEPPHFRGFTITIKHTTIHYILITNLMH